MEKEYQALLAFGEAARQSAASVVPPPGIADAVIKQIRIEKAQGGPKKPEGGGGSGTAPLMASWLSMLVGALALVGAAGGMVVVGVRRSHLRAGPTLAPVATATPDNRRVNFIMGEVVNEDDVTWKVTSGDCKGPHTKTDTGTLTPKGTDNASKKLGFGYAPTGDELTCTITLVDGNSTCTIHGGQRCVIRGGKLVFTGSD